ncbi:N-acetylglucosaminidase [Ammoniphilus sp. CFH 90114]|uniref:N-acetylglucosaminidase n=1 Tax=Ammoniphilus sp. CFH 90114 TaxID=2493665 RepID=UPI00100F3807|nr:glucosaminidase domain-containing protein [Ammoniphilus sp. CFH 90114]RXT08083.1 hypothetical protein EIZ39_11780 [Ammoniphilus sp. CFH 90114]
MYQKSLTSMLTFIFTSIIAIYNPVVAAGIEMFGQAGLFTESSEMLQEIPDEPSHVVQAPVEDLVQEAREEKQSMENTTASILYQSMKQSEEVNQEFIQLVKTTDVTRLDLRKPSGLSQEQADALIEGTGLEGLGKAFVETEERYQVNAYYLIAHAAWESAWGRSRISKEKNNLFGFSAYDQSPYQSARKFASKEEGIDAVARYISEHYLSEDGKYYNGAHLEGMNIRYATDENWQNGIGKVIVSLAKKTPPVEELKLS